MLHTRCHVEHPSHLVMQVTVSDAQEKPGHNVKDLTRGHTASEGRNQSLEHTPGPTCRDSHLLDMHVGDVLVSVTGSGGGRQAQWTEM